MLAANAKSLLLQGFSVSLNQDDLISVDRQVLFVVLGIYCALFILCELLFFSFLTFLSALITPLLKSMWSVWLTRLSRCFLRLSLSAFLQRFVLRWHFLPDVELFFFTRCFLLRLFISRRMDGSAEVLPAGAVVAIVVVDGSRGTVICPEWKREGLNMHKPTFYSSFSLFE